MTTTKGAEQERRLPLAGRVAVVTGSTRGLGLAMARVVGHGGAKVVVSSRSDSHVRTAVDSLRAEGISATEAAGPLLRLVTTNRFVYRGLRPPTLLTRAVRNIAAGRLRATNRIRLEVSTLNPSLEPREHINRSSG